MQKSTRVKAATLSWLPLPLGNAGAITSGENGQILLVASKDKVYLQPASGTSPFAGLLVEVGTGGRVSNEAGGQLSSNQGNITLAGFAVNQNGRIKATTSVNVNGSVRLLAREDAILLGDSRGIPTIQARRNIRDKEIDGLKKEATVTFGSKSSVAILADPNGGSAIDEQEQKQSLVEVSANKIRMESDSSVVATAGQVNFTASNLGGEQVNNTGRIYLDSGCPYRRFRHQRC